jgi:subtilisin family serine protease
MTEEDRQRVRDQVELIVEENRGRVAWDSDDASDLGYLFDPGVVLVRTDSGRVAVDDVLQILNDEGEFGVVARREPDLGDDSGRTPLNMARIDLPGPEGPDRRDPRLVLRALDLLDAREVNIDDERVASPEHWVHLSRGTSRLCPAIEPRTTDETEPWPAVAADASLGEGVRVSIVDSGWHDSALEAGSIAAQWLGGVDGDPEPPGTMLRPYGGHGTFIAGVVRCLAPSAGVRVERFTGSGFALREWDMVVQLRQALNNKPHLINLSAGSTTRKDRPLLSFERFWNRDLSEVEDCLLVAAAGNDGSPRHFWPASFDWAVGVGSLDRNGSVSKFSNHGGSTDVYAVGRGLVNAFPLGDYTCREAPNKGKVRSFTTGLARWSGTSFAAPVVAGLIAAELTGGGNVHDAWAAVLARAGTVVDRDGDVVPALLPPYS